VSLRDRDSSIRRRWQLCLAVRGAALPPCLPILPHPFGRGVASLSRHRRPFPLRHSLASLFRACCFLAWWLCRRGLAGWLCAGELWKVALDIRDFRLQLAQPRARTDQREFSHSVLWFLHFVFWCLLPLTFLNTGGTKPDRGTDYCERVAAAFGSANTNIAVDPAALPTGTATYCRPAAAYVIGTPDTTPGRRVSNTIRPVAASSR